MRESEGVGGIDSSQNRAMSTASSSSKKKSAKSNPPDLFSRQPVLVTPSSKLLAKNGACLDGLRAIRRLFVSPAGVSVGREVSPSLRLPLRGWICGLMGSNLCRSACLFCLSVVWDRVVGLRLCQGAAGVVWCEDYQEAKVCVCLDGKCSHMVR